MLLMDGLAPFTLFESDPARTSDFWEKTMSRRAAQIGTLVAVVLAAFSLPTAAEVTSIAAHAQAEVTEFRSGGEGDTDRASESYPETSAVLPIHAIARLTSSGFLGGIATEEAAAAVAAQFADPRVVTSPNPGEFAINLALNSISENIRYQARAITQETRGVLYSAGEAGLLTLEGTEVNLTGRLFLDGALTLLAGDATKDLRGAYVNLSVTVVKRVDGQPEQTVFAGAVELSGAADGGRNVNYEGSFPTEELALSDRALGLPEFAAFHVLIIPNITIDYPYPATVGEEFTLEATVEVTAANLPDRCCVAAVLGTPTDTLTQVIGLTQGAQVASETVGALNSERENAGGTAGFSQPTGVPLLLPLCGGLGFETLIGLAALAGIRNFVSPGRHARK